MHHRNIVLGSVAAVTMEGKTTDKGNYYTFLPHVKYSRPGNILFLTE